MRRPRRAGRATSDAERRRLAQAHRERPPRKGSKRPVLWCDGGSRGNPGPSAYGYVIEAPGGELLAEVAERLGLNRLEVRMDSQLAVAQLNREREPRNAAVRALLDQAQELAASVGPVRYSWVSRERTGARTVSSPKRWA